MYPSVTTVLSPYTDFSGIPEEVLAKAADRGTRAHRLCELYAKGLFIMHVDEDCVGFFESFKRWFDSTVIEVVALEIALEDYEYKFQGHPDLICKLKGSDELVVVDYKTPLAAQLTWRIQLAAYKRLANVGGYPVTRRATLRLNREGKSPIFNEYTKHEHDLNVFLNACACWHFFKQQ